MDDEQRKIMNSVLSARHAAVYGVVFARHYNHEAHTETAHLKAMAAAHAAREESKRHFKEHDAATRKWRAGG